MKRKPNEPSLQGWWLSIVVRLRTERSEVTTANVISMLVIEVLEMTANAIYRYMALDFHNDGEA